MKKKGYNLDTRVEEMKKKGYNLDTRVEEMTKEDRTILELDLTLTREKLLTSSLKLSYAGLTMHYKTLWQDQFQRMKDNLEQLQESYDQMINQESRRYQELKIFLDKLAIQIPLEEIFGLPPTELKDNDTPSHPLISDEQFNSMLPNCIDMGKYHLDSFDGPEASLYAFVESQPASSTPVVTSYLIRFNNHTYQANFLKDVNELLTIFKYAYLHAKWSKENPDDANYSPPTQS